MPSRILPGIGLTAFWDVGTPYKTEMDANLRALSALAQLVVISATTTLPASPADGDVYINPTAGANVGKIAVRDAAAWVYMTPKLGWRAWVADTGQQMVYDGSAWVSITGGATGRLLKLTKFTASGTWTRQAGSKLAVVEAVGGGGGGGGAAAGTAFGAGGGAGGFHKIALDVTSLASAPVVIGAAGTAGAVGVAGGNGGLTSFNAPIVQSDGGIGGPPMAAGTTPSISQGGNGGTAGNTGAEINSNGAAGGDGIRLASGVGVSGAGAPGPYGGGGQPRAYQSDGQPGTGPGSGGSGGGSTAAGTLGGAGAPGRVLIWEYS